MIRRLMTAMLVVGIATACSNDADDLIDDLKAAVDQSRRIECACDTDEDDDRDACVDEGSFHDVDCLKDVIDEHFDDVEDEVRCEVRRVEAQADCLENVEGCNSDDIEACYESSEDCDDDSLEAIEDELDACG